MQRKKYSGSFNDYTKKLDNVMERLGIEKYEYNWSKSDCFIEFFYKNQFYRFEHSLEKAENQKITCVSDLFAQLVYTLEDIARMTERGIYELSTWIAGMKALPPQKEVPFCFMALGFNHIPETLDEVKSCYKKMAKYYHPDVETGDEDMFKRITKAYEDAKKHYE